MGRPSVYVIAEAGVNHNGSLTRALEMIKAAREAGADAVKFQAWRAENLVTRSAEKAAYQAENTGEGGSQLEMLKGLELAAEDHTVLRDACVKAGIDYMCSPFDLPSVDLLVELGVSAIKVPSGEITNLPFLRKIGAAGCDVILSTGMSDTDEIGDALNVLTNAGTPLAKIVVLHCNTEYPTPFEDVNLLAMPAIAEQFGVAVGYSDHTPGIEVPVAAAALGAKIVEKHFTLDRSLPGPDHLASLEADELAAMVTAIRHIETALGSSEKKPTPSETKNIAIARRSIVAGRDIRAGETLDETNLAVKRPGTGISPMRWDQIVGTKAGRDYAADDLIEQEEPKA